MIVRLEGKRGGNYPGYEEENRCGCCLECGSTLESGRKEGCNYWGFSARGGLIDFRVAIAVAASRELETVYGCIY